MFSIRDLAFGINPSGNSMLFRPAKPIIVSLRESANSPDALRRSSKTPLIDSIPACIASRIDFIRSAALSASSAALSASAPVLDASLYFFCSSARISPKPRPSLRLSLILFMKLPMPSPTADAKSVFENSIIEAPRPIRNSPAASALSAMPSIKFPTVLAKSKSFTS